eukprot:scaffold28654_cov70-Phaeocystis_antarctica.AAC.3
MEPHVKPDRAPGAGGSSFFFPPRHETWRRANAPARPHRRGQDHAERRRGTPLLALCPLAQRKAHRHRPLRRGRRVQGAPGSAGLQLGVFPQSLRLRHARRGERHPRDRGPPLAGARGAAGLHLRGLVQGGGGPADRDARRFGAAGDRPAQGGVRLCNPVAASAIKRARRVAARRPLHAARAREGRRGVGAWRLRGAAAAVGVGRAGAGAGAGGPAGGQERGGRLPVGGAVVGGRYAARG